MRTIGILLALLCSVCNAADIEDSFWGNEEAKASLIIISDRNQFLFRYVNEGKYRCEIPGIARSIKDAGSNIYIFKNNREHWRWEHYEGNGFPDINGDCSVEFYFAGKSVTIKSSGNCRSFCGAGGDIDATLTKVIY